MAWRTSATTSCAVIGLPKISAFRSVMDCGSVGSGWVPRRVSFASASAALEAGEPWRATRMLDSALRESAELRALIRNPEISRGQLGSVMKGLSEHLDLSQLTDLLASSDRVGQIATGSALVGRTVTYQLDDGAATAGAGFGRGAALGAAAFGTVVVLTMLAAQSFDPRLIWDRPQSSEKHS